MFNTETNTDKEIYREPVTKDSEGGNNSGIEPYVFVTQSGGIGFNYYGKCVVKPIKSWVEDAWGAEKKIEQVTGVHSTINGDVVFDLDDDGTITIEKKINEIIKRLNEIK
jgi:hypothetical protein